MRTACFVLCVASSLLVAAPTLAHAGPRLPGGPAPSQVVASFEPGEFVEGVYIDLRGDLYACLAFSGRIMKVAPDGSVTVFAQVLPDRPMPTDPFALLGLLVQASLGTIVGAIDGELYVTVHALDPALNGIWRIAPDGTKTQLSPMDPSNYPNGLTLGYDGFLYVADSDQGLIWRIDRHTGAAAVWLDDPLLKKDPDGIRGPGANGIKFYGLDAFISNSSTATIVRVPLSYGRPGVPRIYASGVPGDDFSVDLLGNLYVATHPFNTVIRIGTDGTQTVLAGPDQDVLGPTATAFGRSRTDLLSVYAVTDGGLIGSVTGYPPPRIGLPSIVKLDVGIIGYPFP